MIFSCHFHSILECVFLIFSSKLCKEKRRNCIILVTYKVWNNSVLFIMIKRVHYFKFSMTTNLFVVLNYIIIYPFPPDYFHDPTYQIGIFSCFFHQRVKMNKLPLYSTIASSFIYVSAFFIKTLEKRLIKLFMQKHSRLFLIIPFLYLVCYEINERNLGGWGCIFNKYTI